MIVYDLECEHSHRFEGWFASNEEYEQQLSSKLLTCPVCGNAGIMRRPSAAYVNTGAMEKPTRTKNENGMTISGKPQQVANISPEMVAKVIEHIVKNTEDVGTRFPEEARKIYYQEAPERHIRGTASTKEVESLRDEGIDVVALPIPSHLSNKTH